MEYKNEKLGARFVVPDKLTVRQQMAYVSEATYTDEAEKIERLWKAATGIILEWECPGFSIDADLNKETNPSVFSAMFWAAIKVRDHISQLEDLPKN